MRFHRVGVLMGGLSSESKVSLETGNAVVAALEELGYPVEPIFVDRDIDLVLRQSQIDVAFIALHGRYGEDGCIQGMLETLGIPYTGSGVLASALAMNKVKTKELMRLHNVPTPGYYTLDRRHEADPVAHHADFGYPVVVKPVSEGSSVGVEVVNDADELTAACERGFCFDDELLVERFIDGQEVSVAIVGDQALGAVEIVPHSGFYDYAAKYSSGAADYHIPPRLSPERYHGILNQALRAHRALGCKGTTRVDLMVQRSGNEYVLEINTVPGLTPTSLLPKVAAAAGLSFTELIDACLCGAQLGIAGRGNGNRRIAQRLFVGDDRREPMPEHH